VVLNQALKLEAAKTATRLPPRLWEVTSAPSRTKPTPPQRRRDGRPLCWQCGIAAQYRRHCRQTQLQEDDQCSGIE
jgi:hypothetical protein